MIPIYNHNKIRVARREHFKGLKAMLSNYWRYLSDDDIRDWVKSHYKQIILAKPNELKSWQERFDKEFGKNESNYAMLTKFFSYNNFKKKSRRDNLPGNQYCAYDICETLKIKSCPYCNIHKIHTIENKQRPALDHFFCQKDHPLLALSFYNLVPSCTFCNTTYKRDFDFEEDTNINPYREHFDGALKFNFLMEDYRDYMSIQVNHVTQNLYNFHLCGDSAKNRRVCGNFKTFNLRRRYEECKEDIVENLHLVIHKNEDYSASLRAVTDESEDQDSFYLRYNVEDNWHNVSYGKITSDFIRQYNLD